MEQVLAAEGKPLSQAERVVDTFIAPSKTFTDLLLSTAWWLPAILFFVFSACFAYTVDKKIGFEAVTEQSIQKSPMAQDRMDSLPPADRAAAIHRQAVGTKYFSYAGGVFYLLFPLIFALLNWATINFGFGARTTFGQNYALQIYAALPLLLKTVLTIVLIVAGVGTENFDMRNPIGTNLGYYLSDSPAWLGTFLTFFDFFSLWALALTIIGLAIISGKSIAKAATAALIWWVLMVLAFTGLTAAFS
jgi:hypothetical protein